MASRIVTTGTGPVTDLALLNLRHIWAPLYPVELSLNVLWIVWKILDISWSRSNLIFNVHGSANIAPIVAARVLGIPVVWHFHETVGGFRPLINLGRRMLRKHPHQLVCVSYAGRRDFNLLEAAIIPGSVDTGFWSPLRVSRDDGSSWAPHALRILTVGNLNPLKGADILLEALAQLKAPWHLKIAGAELATHRQYGRALRRRAMELTGNIDAKVDFLGWQDSQAVRSLMASCDVFVLPSRSEACPIALLEAMSMGAMCVASDVGDTAAILGEGRLGTLVAADDPEQLAIALSEIRKLPEDVKKCRSTAARQRAINDFSIERIAASMLGIYRNLVSVH